MVTIDLTFIENEIGTNEQEIINELLVIFQGMMADYQEKMKKAIELENYEDIFQISHKIAPSCSMIGIQELFLIMKNTEKLSKGATGLAEIKDDYISANNIMNDLHPQIEKVLTN